MTFYVYLILTKHKNKLTSYVGYTNNLEKRLNNHNNSKGAKFTKGKKWKLIYSKKYATKKIAMKEEYLLKYDRKRRNKIKQNYLI
jgi:putative endonuclease